MQVIDLNEKPKQERQPSETWQQKPVSLLAKSPRAPKRKLKVMLAIIFAIILILLGTILWKANAIGSKIFGSHISFFQQASSLITNNSAAAKLQGEDQGQINIVLLGYGGTGHDGPYLTDSIILASIRPTDKKILLTSIPRDTYYLTAQGEKINAVFPSGFNAADPTITTQDIESGGAASEAAIGQLSGQTVPYFVSMDFQGFVDAINRVGGIEVNVENTFTDDQYPNGDSKANGPNCTAPVGDTASPCRYIEVHFDAGPQTMDGATALEYTRSRHGNGIEGSDFARSRRQQLVLEAFKTKIENLNLFSDASAVNDLLNILADHLHTNMTLAQVNHLAQIVHQSGMQVASQSLDPTTGLVCNAILPTDGAFVVQPCAGVTSASIAEFFQDGFQYAPLRSEQATVIMENAGNSTTEYDEIKKDLTDAGATVYDVGYHGTSTTQSEIYFVNKKPATEAYLQQQLGVTPQPLPSNLTAETDLVVIIGSRSATQ